MIRRYDITYTALRMEAVRISAEVFDAAAAPGNPQPRPRGYPRPASGNTPTPTWGTGCNRTIDWRGAP